MSTPPPGPPGPQFEPPASSVPGQPQDPGRGRGPQFSASGAGPQYPGPQDPAVAPYPPDPTAGGLQGYPATVAGEPAAPTHPERVGLGLAVAGVVVLGCIALTAVIYHWGFIASITAWLMAIGASAGYRRVGGEPVKGRVPLLVLILVGIVLGFLAMVASAVWDYYWLEMGGDGTTAEAIQLVLDNLFNVELWQELGTDAVFYFLFAALGAFGVIRRMSGTKRATT